MHSMRDDRGTKANVRGVPNYVEDAWMQGRLAAHEIHRCVLIERPEFVQRANCVIECDPNLVTLGEVLVVAEFAAHIAA
jgi:hypothetical protein